MKKSASRKSARKSARIARASKGSARIEQFPSIRMETSELLVCWAIAVATGWESAVTLFLEGVTRLVIKATRGNPDWVQESLVRIWQHFREYDPSKGELSTWVYAQVKGGGLYARRKEERNILFSTLDTPDEEYQSRIPSLDNDVQIAEEMDAIASFLDAEQSAALTAYFMGTEPDDISGTFDDAAKVLGLTKAGARLRILAIVNAARRHFGVKGKVTGFTKYGMTLVK